MNARLNHVLLVLALLTPVFTATSTGALGHVRDRLVVQVAPTQSPLMAERFAGVLNAEEAHTALYTQLGHAPR